MKYLLSTLVIGCAVALAGVPVLAQRAQPVASNGPQEDAANSPQQDQAFLRSAAEGGLDEVTLGNLAEQKSHDPEIQAFARRMVRDHTRINGEIAPIAERLGVIPSPKLADQDQLEFEKLRLMPVADFNKAYVLLMVHAHRTDLAAFQHESHAAANPQLKQVAGTAATVIAEHLRLATQLSEHLGMDTKSTAQTGV